MPEPSRTRTLSAAWLYGDFALPYRNDQGTTPVFFRVGGIRNDGFLFENGAGGGLYLADGLIPFHAEPLPLLPHILVTPLLCLEELHLFQVDCQQPFEA